MKLSEYPRGSSSYDQICFLLEFAQRAPSTHNSQPWKFEISESSCKIHADKPLMLPEVDAEGRDFYISLGCCLENLILAAKYYGVYSSHTIRVDEVSTVVAEVVFKLNYSKQDLYLKSLIESIPNRTNARGVFLDEPVPNDLIEIIKGYNVDNDMEVKVVTDPTRINKLAALTADAIRDAYKSKAFREEFSRWIVSNYSKRLDGIPGYSVNMPGPVSVILPKIMKRFNIGKKLSQLNLKSIGGAPAIVVVALDKETKDGWIKIGRYVQRTMLRVHAAGLQSSIFVAGVEIGDSYKNIRTIADLNGKPQFLFCIGKMKGQFKPTQRHPVTDKIINIH